jgi:hypothetical protein
MTFFAALETLFELSFGTLRATATAVTQVVP